MNSNIKTIEQSINGAFLKVNPTRQEIDKFKIALKNMLDKVNEDESEEYHKNLISKFLESAYLNYRYFINTKARNDLVIYKGEDIRSGVGVIIETKRPTNKAEMLTKENINVKALQELLLYYLRERISNNNYDLKYLIATNLYEWFVFDAAVFEKCFYDDKKLVEEFKKFEEKKLSGHKTDFFYNEIALLAIEDKKSNLEYSYVNLKDYTIPLYNEDKNDDKKLIALHKLFSPEHLLKLPFINDSNTLDKAFYSELLHIVGLKETIVNGKKLIVRKEANERYEASLLESTISQLDDRDILLNISNSNIYGQDKNEKLFNIALELVITWINRILFLKLLEGQILSYHKGNEENFSFLDIKKIKSYDDLDSLFFQVLAKKTNERKAEIQKEFKHVPYLNSSLFEATKLEKNAIYISNLNDKYKLPIFTNTVLKDSTGKKKNGELNTLEYLFEFLNAYDFGSEGSEEIQEENKTLISASVLGLIFEKINGYKDGSFFTPGFITMYMAEEVIERAVINKFNEVQGLNCKTLNDVHGAIEDKKRANEIINSIKICDPAVGSGHFLVSALNKLIAIKSDLKILLDDNGRVLRDYDIKVENDELIIRIDNTTIFQYKPGNEESQRVQQTLFREKETIIENCLFGVDINPNSVNICRLRLWIELLKSAYYKPETDYKELETLPNIDINIKHGNSLISKFELTEELKDNSNITLYREDIRKYKTTDDKEERYKLISEINSIKASYEEELFAINKSELQLTKLKREYNKLNHPGLNDAQKKEIAPKLQKVKKQIEKIEKELNKQGTKDFFMENISFEWRYEFPEVLDDNGRFTGFDVVIGNPPYIRQEEISDIKSYLKTRYKVYDSIADILTYFVELGYNILKPEGIFAFIISNKFTRTNYGRVLRKFLSANTALTHFIDFSGLSVFDEATVDAAILGFTKNTADENLLVYTSVDKNSFKSEKCSEYINEHKVLYLQENLGEESWTFESEEVLGIKKKIEEKGTPLKDWNIDIKRGILTGYNEAFIIDDAKKDELIKKDPKSAEIIKPLLRGRDIKRYYADFQGQWLIGTFPSLHLDIDKYIAIKEYLSSFGNRLEQSGEKGCRKKTTNKWFETQDTIAYHKDFEKPKVVYPNMTKYLPFYLDVGSFYTNQKCFILTGDNISFLAAFLNSKVFKFCFRDNFPELLGGTRELSKVFFDKIPVIKPTNETEEAFKELVQKIQELKKEDPECDTSGLEAEIDALVYKLYSLSDDEIRIIEESVKKQGL